MAVQSVYLCWAQSSKFKNSKLIIDSVGFKKSTLNQLLELHFERGLGDGLHSKPSSIALKGDILWDVDRQSLLSDSSAVGICDQEQARRSTAAWLAVRRASIISAPLHRCFRPSECAIALS